MDDFANKQDLRQNSPKKFATLNPNAAAFVPSSLGLFLGSDENGGIRKEGLPGTFREPAQVFPASCTLDGANYEYCSHQLPEDISLDFNIAGEDNFHVPGDDISLSELCINDRTESSWFGDRTESSWFGDSERSSLFCEQASLAADSRKIIYTDGYSKSQSSDASKSCTSNPVENQFINGVKNAPYSMDNVHYIVQGSGFKNDRVDGSVGLSNFSVNHVEFLASHFPGFAAESLADVYCANGCDLKLTFEMLTQLEIQVEVDSEWKPKSNDTSAGNALSLNSLDFPALPKPSTQSDLPKCLGEDHKEASNAYQLFDKGGSSFFNSSSSSVFFSAPDFASAVRKPPSQDSDNRSNVKTVAAFTSAGSVRNSEKSCNLYNVNSKTVGVDKPQNIGTSRSVAAWLPTGDAVGNMYSESREEARDLARLRNACFEQARQAYLIGNKALAKELSLKGQMHNMQMKAAHEKAREIIYKQRNPISPLVQGRSGGQDPLIDLHGLHVTEAIRVLKDELSILRRTARSAGQRLQVMICVGTGHHTKGSRTPARLPVAVENYLLEEGIHYTEPQQGLLRAIIR